MGYKVLVSGCGGYIGSLVTRKLLDEGHYVIGLDNGFRNIDNLLELCPNPNFHFIKGDVLNKGLVAAATAEADITIHLAALVGEPICAKNPNMAQLVNVDGTKNVCFGNTKIIFASTGSVYGQLASTCTEESATNPVSLYAKNKLESEKYIRFSSSNHIIYRFATAFGLSPNTRLDLLVNDLTYQAWKNKTITLFQPDFKRTFCHVDDIASSLVYAVKHFDEMRGDTYNVGIGDGNWSKRQLAEFLKKRTNCSVFYAEQGYKDPDVRDYYCDFSKIKRTGWIANYTIERGVDELLKAMPVINLSNQYGVV